MFSFLNASHCISPHLAPENCEDLVFFLVNGSLKAGLTSTVTANLMGYYSCSKYKNRTALKASAWKSSDMVEAEMRKRRKWEIWAHAHIYVFPSVSEVYRFQWNIELTGLPVSPAEHAALAEKGHITFGVVQLVFLVYSFQQDGKFYSPYSTIVEL